MHKKVIHWWHGRRIRFYRNSRWHLVIDISLSVLVLLLVGVSFRLSLYHPKVIAALNFTHNEVQNNPSFSILTQIDNSSVANGEDIALTINYINDGDVKLDTLIIFPDFNSAAFKVNELILLDNDNDNIFIENNSLVLKNILIGQSGDLSLLVKWKAVKTDFPREIKWTLHAEADYNQQKIVRDQMLSSVKIMSNFNILANIYFHSPQGDQLGIGPLPPIVGIPTTYWLIIKANNLGNELKDLVFSANLPEGVELSGDKSLLAGKFSYDEVQRRLIWQLDSLDAKDGNYIANFALDFIPKESQVGKNAVILNNLRYSVIDTWLNTNISGSLNNLDSSLLADHLNYGLGVVEAE